MCKYVPRSISLPFLLLGLQLAPFPLGTAPATDSQFTVRITAPLEFTLTQGDASVRSPAIVLKNVGESSINWTASATERWLRIEPASGSLPRHEEVEITLIADAGGFSPGIYEAKIQIAIPDASPHQLVANMTEQSAFTAVPIANAERI